MAMLTSGQLTTIRNGCERHLTPTYTKPQINAGLQAVEDWFEANRASLGTAIEVAMPGVFTNAQKKQLVKHWLLSKFGRE